jgi:Sulfate permease and related transporters (MFS superfamily)
VQSLKQDLPASIVVFFVALPLCLGIALASGAPLMSGLLAGVVGGLVVGSISRSALGVSGPAAGLTVIVLGAIQTLGSFEVFLSALVIAGVLQVALGLLRAGVLGYFFPSAVIHGMLTGIGLIIILKQLPYALGQGLVGGGASGSLLATLSSLGSVFHPGVVLISLLSALLLLLWDSPAITSKRWLSLVPGAVVAVVVAVACQFLFRAFPALELLPSQLVAVPVTETPAAFLDLLVTPDFSQLTNPLVWEIALTITIVASLETLLSVEAIDKIDPRKRLTPTNRELVAQGVGNAVAGLIGGLPVTQVIVRSSVNMQAGAQSRASAIAHGALLLVSLMLVPQLINLIPLGVLAAVLILTGYKLAKPALFKHMWQGGMEQFLPFIVTVLGVVFTDLLEGVAMGMAVAIVILLQRHYQNSHFLHLKERDTPDDRHVVTLELAEEVSFLNKGAIKKELSEIPDGCLVVIDQSNCIYMNPDVAEIIADFMQSAPSRGILVELITTRARDRKRRTRASRSRLKRSASTTPAPQITSPSA